MKKTIKLASWGVVALGSLFGASKVLTALLDTNLGWPATAATAAIGIGFAVVPYCIARAVNEILYEVEL